MSSFLCYDQTPWPRQLKRESFGFTVPGEESVMAGKRGRRSRQLRAHILNCRHQREPLPLLNFLQEACTSYTPPNSPTDWTQAFTYGGPRGTVLMQTTTLSMLHSGSRVDSVGVLVCFKKRAHAIESEKLWETGRRIGGEGRFDQSVICIHECLK